MQSLQPKLSQIPGVLAFANNPPAFGGFGGQPVQFVVRNSDFDRLTRRHGHAGDARAADPRAINVDTDLRVNKPELTVSFDRDRAEDLGVPVSDVAGALQALLGGPRDQHLHAEQQALRRDGAALAGSARHALRHGRASSPRPRRRTGSAGRVVKVAGGRRAHVSSTTSTGCGPAPVGEPGARLHPGRGARLARALSKEVLPAGSNVALAGESANSRRAAARSTSRSCSRWSWSSWCWPRSSSRSIHPFTVLLAVPLAVTRRALHAAIVADSTINLYSQIGMILLIGLVDQELDSARGVRQPAARNRACPLRGRCSRPAASGSGRF